MALMGALTGFVRRLLVACLAPFPPRRPRVLLYHGIDTSDSTIALRPEVFAAQMEWLARNGYATWPASVYVRALREGVPLPRRLVVVTFDDGYANNLELALPELEARGFTATAFVVVGDLGKTPGWGERDRERIAALAVRTWAKATGAERAALAARVGETLARPLATLDQWIRAQARGFEVASHGFGHRFLDQEPAAVVTDDLRGARDALRAAGASGADVLAWPYGASSPHADAIARTLGIEAAFAAEWRWSRRQDRDLMQLNRVPLDPRLGAFGIVWACSRAYELWQWLRARTGRGPR